MQQHEKNQTMTDRIARYNQELLELYRRQRPVQANINPDTNEENWLDRDFPSPDIQRDKASLASLSRQQTPTPTQAVTPIPETPAASSQTQAAPAQTPTFPYTDEDLQGQVPRPEETPTPPAEGPSPYTGYLRVFVFSGNAAEPLPGARVVISRKEQGNDILFANAATDIDGFTPVIPLPSVNPALTLQPNVPNPYVAYDIQVLADGFVPTIYENVPVYGNNYVTQPAAMIPLLPGQDPSVPRIIRSGAPSEL